MAVDEPTKYSKVYSINTKLTEKFPINPYRTVGMIDTDDAIYCMCQISSSTGNYEIYKLDIPSDGLTPIYNRTLTWKSAGVLNYSKYGYIYHYQKPNYYRMNDKDGDYKCFIVTGNTIYSSDNPVGPFTKVTGNFLTSTAPSNIVYIYSKYCIIYQYRLYSSVDGVNWSIENPNLYDMTKYQGLFILNNQLVAAVVGDEYSYLLIETSGSLPGKWKEYKYLASAVEGEYKNNYIESVNDLLLNEVCGEDIIVISKTLNNYFSYQAHPVNFKDGLPTGNSILNFYSPYVTDANDGFSLIHSSQSYENEYYLCSESKLNDVKPTLSIYSKLDAGGQFTGVSTDTSISSNILHSFQLDTPTGFHVSKNCDYVISYPSNSSEYIKTKLDIDVDPYIWVACSNSDNGLYYSTDGKVWTRSNKTSGSFDAVYNANGIWVACSNSRSQGIGNGLYYSTDGKVWTQSNITSGYFYTVYNANGIWVAGCDSLYYSTDGKIWNQSNISSGDFYNVYNANGVWVAGVRYRNGLYYSTDGKVWNQSNITSGGFASIYNGNGIWVAGGYDDNGLYYSTDGKVWNQSNVVDGDFYAVYYANDIWVACGIGRNRGLYYSTDGRSWTQSNVTSGDFESVYNGNGIWVAGSRDGLYYSTDGRSWTQSNVTSGVFRFIYNANGIWIANNTNASNSLYYSTDGKSWTQSNISSESFNDIYSIVNIMVGAIGSNGLYYSTDGKIWGQSNITNGDFDFTSVYNANGIWVACGYNKGLYYSTDGKVWTSANTASGHFYTPYNANGVWVTGSSNGNGLYYSTDGKVWNRSNITSGDFFTVYNANGVWVTGSYSDKGLYYSTDGKVWTQSNITSGYFYSIYNANGVWVACSMNNNGLYYSTDGKSWTRSNMTTGMYWIYYGNGIWVAGNGNGNGLYYSTDGKSWTRSNMTTGSFLTVYNANGIWVAGGGNGSINKGLYYSTDGKVWTQSNITNVGFYSVSNTNGIWVAGGSSALFYSTDGKVWYEADTSGFIISKNPNSEYKSCLIESDANVEIYKYNSANRDLLGEVKKISLRENGDILNNYKPEKTMTYLGTKYVLDKTELYTNDMYAKGSYTLRVWYKQATDEPSQPSPGGGDPSGKDKTIYNSAFYHF